MVSNLTKFGLVSPEGVFYESDFCCHSSTASRIVGEEECADARLKLEMAGWVFICQDDTWGMSMVYACYHKPTQAQIDTCFDHSVEFGLREEFEKLKERM